jgi:hypothetical protein
LYIAHFKYGLVIYCINTKNTKYANLYGSVINKISPPFSVGIEQGGGCQRHWELNNQITEKEIRLLILHLHLTALPKTKKGRRILT